MSFKWGGITSPGQGEIRRCEQHKGRERVRKEGEKTKTRAIWAVDTRLTSVSLSILSVCVFEYPVPTQRTYNNCCL